jgi:hypothetical protein
MNKRLLLSPALVTYTGVFKPEVTVVKLTTGWADAIKRKWTNKIVMYDHLNPLQDEYKNRILIS